MNVFVDMLILSNSKIMIISSDDSQESEYFGKEKLDYTSENDYGEDSIKYPIFI